MLALIWALKGFRRLIFEQQIDKRHELRKALKSVLN